MRRKEKCCRGQPAAGGVSGETGYFCVFPFLPDVIPWKVSGKCFQIRPVVSGPFFPAAGQVITGGDHHPDIVVRNRSIQNNRIPVGLIQMICRYNRRISIPPEPYPFRSAFHIDPDMSVFWKDPGEYFSGMFMPHHAPVRVVKRIVFVYRRKPVAVCGDLFFFFQQSVSSCYNNGVVRNDYWLTVTKSALINLYRLTFLTRIFKITVSGKYIVYHNMIIAVLQNLLWKKGTK